MRRKNKCFLLRFCLLCFFIISLLSIYYSQKILNNYSENLVIKQLIFYIIGIIIFYLAYKYKEEIIKYSWLGYIICTLLLVMLLFWGVSINGSKCWIILGPLSFQPSEFMKIFLVIIIAQMLDKYKYSHSLKKELPMLIKLFVIILIPSIFTYLEPDTGVILVYILTMISMLLFRGINKKWNLIFISILIFSVTVFSLIYIFNKETLIKIVGNNVFYRINRIINWSNQNGYQLENSLITIGAAGVTGFGFKSYPIYFPEANTDFIFTTFSAIFGFVGNVIFLLIIILFDFNIIGFLNKKTGKMDQFLLIGLLSMLTYQQIQNISMTIGLLPITGITLPFISYGGSSLISYMFALGIIYNIANNQIKYIN